jgi:hypothetical protein
LPASSGFLIFPQAWDGEGDLEMSATADLEIADIIKQNSHQPNKTDLLNAWNAMDLTVHGLSRVLIACLKSAVDISAHIFGLTETI